MNWDCHMQRMDEERLPRKNLEWCPLGKRRKGRPWNLWMQEVQQEWERRELTAWNGSEKNGEEKLN